MIAPARHRDRPAFRRVLDRIVDQVVDDLADRLFVSEDVGVFIQPIALELKLEEFGLCTSSMSFDTCLDNRHHHEWAVLERFLTRLDPSQTEQVENQLIEPFDLLVDSLQESPVDGLVMDAQSSSVSLYALIEASGVLSS